MVRESIEKKEESTGSEGRALAASPYLLTLSSLLLSRGALSLIAIDQCLVMSTLHVNPKFKAGRTTGGGADSVVSSFEGVATLSSDTGSDSDEVGSDGVSAVSTPSASFGMSASYSMLARATEW